jgi:hypothetical protein
LICSICGKHGHVAKRCDQIECSFCGEKGHHVSSCRSPYMYTRD